MKRFYIFMCWGSWGRGETVAEAKANFKKHRGSLNAKDLIVFQVDQPADAAHKPHVNDIGDVLYYGVHDGASCKKLSRGEWYAIQRSEKVPS